MSCDIFNLDDISVEGGCYAIQQGVDYNRAVINLRDEDLSSWTPSAEIRDDYAYKNGAVLATFTFPPLTYGSVTQNGATFDATTFIPTLTATQTILINPTTQRKKEDVVLVGRNTYVYDIKATSPTGEVRMIVRGYVDVKPDVTRI